MIATAPYSTTIGYCGVKSYKIYRQQFTVYMQYVSHDVYIIIVYMYNIGTVTLLLM